MVMALIYKQVKTVTSVLSGYQLTPLYIFFNDIFCESNITLLYNVDLIAKAISKIFKNDKPINKMMKFMLIMI